MCFLKRQDLCFPGQPWSRPNTRQLLAPGRPSIEGEADQGSADRGQHCRVDRGQHCGSPGPGALLRDVQLGKHGETDMFLLQTHVHSQNKLFRCVGGPMASERVAKLGWRPEQACSRPGEQRTGCQPAGVWAHPPAPRRVRWARCWARGTAPGPPPSR